MKKIALIAVLLSGCSLFTPNNVRTVLDVLTDICERYAAREGGSVQQCLDNLLTAEEQKKAAQARVE